MNDDESPSRILLTTVLVAALAAAMNLPFFSQWGGMEDEAVTLLGARQILAGQLPYRDFDTHHTPGSYFITALFLWIFQEPQLVSRGLVCLSAGLLVAALFLLLRVGMRIPTAWCLWACWLCACTGITQWPILNYHWFSTIAGLFGGACLVAWAHHRNKLAAVLAGAFGSLAGWMLQSDGAAVGLGGIAVALLFPQCRRQFFTHFLASVAITSTLLWAPVIASVGFQPIWHCNVDSVRRHGPFGGSPFTWKWVIEPTQGVLQALPRTPPNLDGAVWVVHSFSYLFVWWFKYGFFWIWLVLWLTTRPWQRPPARALLAVLVGFLLLSLYRQDMLYLNYNTPLLYAVLADMLRPRKRLAAAIALGFFLQYGGLLLDVHNSRIPIVTPGGRYYTDNPAVAQDIAEISQWWREFRPDQGTVFAYPFRPALYTLFALKPASHFFMMFPLNYSREDLQTTMEDLRRNQPEWILYSPFSEAIFKDLPKVDPVLFKAESRVYDEQILAGYQLYRDGSTRIYRRRPVEGTAP